MSDDFPATMCLCGDGVPAGVAAGGAIYLIIMSKSLAGTCAVVTSVMWLVALRYGNFQRNSQRLFQDALADTGQAPFPPSPLSHPAHRPRRCHSHSRSHSHSHSHSHQPPKPCCQAKLPCRGLQNESRKASGDSCRTVEYDMQTARIEYC